MTMFKVARCMELNNAPNNAGGNPPSPKTAESVSPGKQDATSDLSAADSTKASSTQEAGDSASVVTGQGQKDAVRWVTVAGEYLKIVKIRDIGDLKDYPYEIFWIMKSFERLVEIIRKHRNEPECLEIMRATIVEARKYSAANVYREELLKIVNALDIKPANSKNPENTGTDDGKAE